MNEFKLETTLVAKSKVTLFEQIQQISIINSINGTLFVCFPLNTKNFYAKIPYFRNFYSCHLVSSQEHRQANHEVYNSTLCVYLGLIF
jgi:hypothetical protein